MNKKAFTLVELLAAIVIMGILITVVSVITVKKVNETKEEAYDQLITSIELAAKNYVIDKGDELAQYKTNDWVEISLDTLVNNEYLDNIRNPKTKSNLPISDIVYVTIDYNGKISATYDINQHETDKLNLNGPYNIYLKKNKTYTELGISINGTSTMEEVSISSNIDITTSGNYKVVYTYSGKTIERNVIVYDK